MMIFPSRAWPGRSVLGTVDQLRSVAAENRGDYRYLAIPRDRPPELVRSILDARSRG